MRKADSVGKEIERWGYHHDIPDVGLRLKMSLLLWQPSLKRRDIGQDHIHGISYLEPCLVDPGSWLARYGQVSFPSTF